MAEFTIWIPRKKMRDEEQLITSLTNLMISEALLPKQNNKVSEARITPRNGISRRQATPWQICKKTIFK